MTAPDPLVLVVALLTLVLVVLAVMQRTQTTALGADLTEQMAASRKEQSEQLDAVMAVIISQVTGQVATLRRRSPPPVEVRSAPPIPPAAVPIAPPEADDDARTRVQARSSSVPLPPRPLPRPVPPPSGSAPPSGLVATDVPSSRKRS